MPVCVCVCSAFCVQLCQWDFFGISEVFCPDLNLTNRGLPPISFLLQYLC